MRERFLRVDSPSKMRAVARIAEADDQPDLFRLLKEILTRFFL